MALKRQPEHKWNWRSPPEPHFQMPGANAIFLGPSGSGKTSTLISILLGPMAKARVFDEIHVWSPSIDLDDAWIPVREYAKGLKASSFNSEWDEKAMIEILDRQKEKIKTMKAAKSKKPLPQCLTIVDDFADSPHILHNASNVLSTLFIRGRHFGSTCWVSSQALSATSPIIRQKSTLYARLAFAEQEGVA
jgi:hypothetical protein